MIMFVACQAVLILAMFWGLFYKLWPLFRMFVVANLRAKWRTHTAAVLAAKGLAGPGKPDVEATIDDAGRSGSCALQKGAC